MTYKKKVRKIKQKGGDVIGASVDLIDNMTSLGRSIFGEITSITHVQDDINNVATPTQGTPNVISGPPSFNPPKIST